MIGFGSGWATFTCRATSGTRGEPSASESHFFSPVHSISFPFVLFLIEIPLVSNFSGILTSPPLTGANHPPPIPILAPSLPPSLPPSLSPSQWNKSIRPCRSIRRIPRKQTCQQTKGGGDPWLFPNELLNQLNLTRSTKLKSESIQLKQSDSKWSDQTQVDRSNVTDDYSCRRKPLRIDRSAGSSSAGKCQHQQETDYRN